MASDQPGMRAGPGREIRLLAVMGDHSDRERHRRASSGERLDAAIGRAEAMMGSTPKRRRSLPERGR
jgi:hypothetical protein